MNNLSLESLKDYSELTPIQQQRYDLLFDIYGHNASAIVTNIYGKGSCSWSSFLEKMDAMEQAKKPQKDYYDALYEALPLNDVYRPGQIISITSIVRRQLGLPQYTEKIKAQSENDFSAIFLYKEVPIEVDGDKDKKELKGYKPLVRIKPE